jgi:hypothetical protein
VLWAWAGPQGWPVVAWLLAVCAVVVAAGLCASALQPERGKQIMNSEIVCSACLTEACAAGILMCEDARAAGIVFRQALRDRRRADRGGGTRG